MKALSLWQPWATAIAVGAKKVETRGWYTPYRGPLAIHAAKRWTAEEREFAEDFQRLGVLPAVIPLGAVVAVCRLVDCHRTESVESSLSEDERGWGNYTPGRWAWMLADVVALPEPIPYRGAQGLFIVPDDIVKVPKSRMAVPGADRQPEMCARPDYWPPEVNDN